MSQQGDKSKKELSDKELAQAAGGADIEGGGGNAVAGTNVIDTGAGAGYVDEEGVFHPGAIPGSVQPAGGAPITGTLNEEGELIP